MKLIRILMVALVAQVFLAGSAHAALVAKAWAVPGTSGDWSTAGNWSPAGVPAATDLVSIPSHATNAYTVTLSAANAASVATLTVGSATGALATFHINSSAATAVTVAGDGAATDDIVIEASGRILNEATGATAAFANASGTKARFKNGSIYKHNSARSFGTPFAAPGSAVTTGAECTMEPTSNQEFGPLVALTSGAAILTGNSGAGANLVGHKYGNLTVVTGLASTTYSFALSGSTTTPLVIQGNIVVQAGVALTLGAGSSNSGLVLNGNIQNDGTVVLFTGTGNGASLGSVRLEPTGGTTTFSGSGAGGTYQITSSTGLTPGQLIVVGANNLVVNRPLTIIGGTNSALQGGTSAITGTGTITAGANASLRIAHPGGFTAQYTGSVVPVTVAGTNYRFNATTAQVTGATMPAIASGVTFLNNAGVTISNGGLTVNGVAAFTSGTVTTASGQSLTVGPVSTPTRAAGYVVGDGYTQTFRGGVNAYARTIHVGTGAQYSPISVTLNGTTATTGTLKVVPTATQHPDVTTPSKAVKRFWTLTPAALGPFNANLTFTYVNADITGLDPGFQEFTLKAERRNGLVWEVANGSTNAATNTTTALGVTAFSPWTLEAVAITAADPIWQQFGD